MKRYFDFFLAATQSAFRTDTCQFSIVRYDIPDLFVHLFLNFLVQCQKKVRIRRSTCYPHGSTDNLSAGFIHESNIVELQDETQENNNQFFLRIEVQLGSLLEGVQFHEGRFEDACDLCDPSSIGMFGYIATTSPVISQMSRPLRSSMLWASQQKLFESGRIHGNLVSSGLI